MMENDRHFVDFLFDEYLVHVLRKLIIPLREEADSLKIMQAVLQVYQDDTVNSDLPERICTTICDVLKARINTEMVRRDTKIMVCRCTCVPVLCA